MKLDKTKIIIFSVKLLIAFTIGAVVIYNIDAIKLKYIVRSADISFIILAAALLPLNLYLQFVKWKYLIDKTASEKTPPAQIWISVILGVTFGFITPGRVGELGKLFVIRNADRFKLLSMSIIEKIYDTFPVIFFGMLSIPFLPHLFFTGSPMMRANMSAFAILVAVITYFVAIHPGLFRTVLNYFKNNIFKNNLKFSRFCDGLHGFKKNNSKILLLMSSCLFIVYTTQFVLLVMSFGDIEVFPAFIGVWSAILLKTFLPFSLGDIGIREGTAAYIFTLFAFPAEAAVSAAFLLFIINILIPSAVGVFFIPFAIRNGRPGIKNS